MRLVAPLASIALILSGCGSAPSEPRARPAAGPAAQQAAVTTTWVATAGDIACPPGRSASGNTCRQAATANLMTTVKRPYRVIALGDNQYENATLWEFQNSYGHSWGLVYNKTWPATGNHEYYTSGARGFFDYFRSVLGTMAGPGYYRRSLNGWQIYVLNTNCSKVDCIRQREWLRAAMRANPTKCSLIAMHHPRYSSGYHGNAHESVAFWDVALNHRTDIALAGHDHNYERFVRLDNASTYSATGILSYVVGTGGKSVGGGSSNRPGSRYFFGERPGLLYLGLRPGGWSWEFRTIDNAVKDSGTGTCV